MEKTPVHIVEYCLWLSETWWLCAGLPTFKQLLSRVKGVVLSALANSELPFSQVLQVLSEDQEFLEETSVLQTAFNLELKADAPEDSLAERITVSTQLATTLWPCFLTMGIFHKWLRVVLSLHHPCVIMPL